MSGFRNKDNSTRNIIGFTIVQNDYAKSDTIRTVKDFLIGEKTNRELDLKNFEIQSRDKKFIDNVLNRFFLCLESPEYMARVKFDEYQARELSERIKSCSLHIYGDTELYYLIQFLNNISHPSELSSNFLTNNGLLVLTSKGLDKLKETITFIKAKSASSEHGEEVLSL